MEYFNNTLTSDYINSLEYLLAGSTNQNDLEEFKAIIHAPQFSHLSQEYIGNAAFLAAFFAGRKTFIDYLMLDKKIPKTTLINSLINKEKSKFNL